MHRVPFLAFEFKTRTRQKSQVAVVGYKGSLYEVVRSLTHMLFNFTSFVSIVRVVPRFGYKYFILVGF